jgi:hypothetical protein
VSKQATIAAIIAMLVVAAVIGGILVSTRGNKVELHGSVLRLRTHPIDPENTVVFADIRVSNPSSQQFVVQEVEVFLDDAAGQAIKGDTFSETDAQRLFTYYPVLGKKHNSNLMIRQKINPGESIDRMVSVRFAGNEERVEKRKRLRIVVTDVDGAKTEITEKL